MLSCRCTYNLFFNYDPLATNADDSCIPFIYGCTDENACNFIPLTDDPYIDVTTDDGSCTYVDGVWYMKTELL